MSQNVTKACPLRGGWTFSKISSPENQEFSKNVFCPLRGGSNGVGMAPVLRIAFLPLFQTWILILGGMCLYRPLFMANHFTNDRPNGGPRIGEFPSRSPENQKITKNDMSKMGKNPKSQIRQNATFGTFPEFPESPDLPDLPTLPHMPKMALLAILALFPRGTPV